MNMSKTEARCVGGDADAVVAHATTAARRSPPRASTSMLAAGDRCTSRRWSAGWRTPASAARRRRVTADRRVGQVDDQLVAGGVDHRPARLDGRRGPRATRSSGSRRTSIRPRVMRETSSRSSTSRTRCVTCRSITSTTLRGRGRRTLPAGAAAAGRSAIGASGLRSSWPSVARNSSLRRSAARSASSARARSARCSRIWYCRCAGAQRGAHRAQQRRHAHRPLEQRHVAQRPHRRARRPRESAPGPREHEHRQVRPGGLAAQHRGQPARCRSGVMASSGTTSGGAAAGELAQRGLEGRRTSCTAMPAPCSSVAAVVGVPPGRRRAAARRSSRRRRRLAVTASRAPAPS